MCCVSREQVLLVDFTTCCLPFPGLARHLRVNRCCLAVEWLLTSVVWTKVLWSQYQKEVTATHSKDVSKGLKH